VLILRAAAAVRRASLICLPWSTHEVQPNRQMFE
jgi:hypothetical protein